KIARHANRLTTLVADVLSLSRLERGLWEMRRDRIDLVSIARAVIDDFQRFAEEKPVSMRLQAPENLIIIGDQEVFRPILGNLVSSAIRYNRPDGEVIVRLERSPETIAITVKDTGIGIPSAPKPPISARFYRVDAHRSRHTGGTGLGLA